MQTDFNGDGKTDVLFFRPNGSAGGVIAEGSSNLSFPRRLTAVKSDLDSRPLAGNFTATAGLTTDLLIDTPLDTDDVVESTVNNKFSFVDSPVHIYNIYQPLLGQFDDDLQTDIFWYRPGPGKDTLWLTEGGAFSAVNRTVNGYYIPLVGDFDGEGHSDIVWYNPVGSSSPVWRATGNGNFQQETISHSVGGISGGSGNFFPIQGDFNGDGKSDIFWYRPGSGSDRIWFGGSTGPADGLGSQSVSGSYRPFVGDFNGDQITDIFWYKPGSGGDSVWLFNQYGGHTSRSLSV